MATAFTRTLRSLQADHFRRAAASLLTAATLLGAWSAWFVHAPVTRYETTGSARLEVDRAKHSIQAPFAGRVVKTRMELGKQVQAGDILVELDSNSERLQIREQRARGTVLDPQIESLRGELAATMEARVRERDAASSALEEARAKVRESEASAQFTTTDAGRYKQLYELGIGSQRQYQQAQSEASRMSATIDSLRQAAERLDREQRTRESDRDVQILRLENEIHRMEGEKITGAAVVDRLEYDLEKRVIRAPITGKLGEVSSLRAGAVLHEGDVLGAIVPSGTLKIVAEFPPSEALGRIRPGQSARMRLQGFPWAQYGSISARVVAVADEVRDGNVRVECELLSSSSHLIPEQHGLPGSVEIEVERVSALTLALRVAGELAAAPGSGAGEAAQ